MHHHVTMGLARQMVHHTVAAAQKGGQADTVITVSKSNSLPFYSWFFNRTWATSRYFDTYFQCVKSCIQSYFVFTGTKLSLPYIALQFAYTISTKLSSDGLFDIIILYLNAKVSQLLLKCYFLFFDQNILLYDIVIDKSNDLPSIQHKN